MKMKTVLENISKLSGSKEGLIFIIAISAFIKILILIVSNDQAINPDGVRYISAAQQFAFGHFKEAIAIYPMPLYPLLIACIHFVIPDWVLAARLISSFSLVLVVIPLYFLTADLFDRKAAFWACLAFTLAPLPNEWVINVIRDPGYVLFFVWTVHFAQRALRSPQLTYFYLAVISFWIATGFRIEGIIFIPVYFFFLVWLTISVPQQRSHFFIGILVWTAIPVFLFVMLLLFISPEQAYFNRVDQVMQEVKNLIQLRFLDNYHLIYQQLKVLEDQSAYTGFGKYNLVAIARHHMLILYLFGLLESLIKVLFPFFALPLLFGFKRPLLRNQRLVIALVISYILMVYYYALKVDYVRTRFLFAPAMLLFPWVGAGLERLFDRTQECSKQTLLAVVFAGIFIVAPLGKIAQSVVKQDNVIVKTGEWLAAQPDFKNTRIVTNDPRIAFYAGRETYTRKKKTIIYHSIRHDYSGIEKFALENKGDIIIIRTSTERLKLLPDLKKFAKVKEFKGKKKIAVIFYSRKYQTTQMPK
ncbi:MAG: glycosyltransferase family 39 protein [Deltaproteobacteria bacterium]|nr:MAG: glycosyltransferase family 39 protein [Deltaproteobacteria bacterium]